MWRSIIAVLIISLSSPLYAQQATGSAAKNNLYEHPSPYLAMHGRDPVYWREWNAQTVALAKQQQKLLFVSSGYFSCHWCHVMQRESYQNEAIAALLNKYFIPVKVDRELNSALDAHLIDFVERTHGRAGWPLNVFVVPEGYPLVGMIYVPPSDFKAILEKLIMEWKANQAELAKLAKAVDAELSQAETTDSTDIPEKLYKKLVENLVGSAQMLADELQGGFGQENKFPSVPQLDALLDIYQHRPSDKMKAFIAFTLEQMASQGLKDQLGGGFYRYVVDPSWQIPHFEKMLYDNALLASLYFKAADILQQPEYADVASETLDFILSTLDTNSPAFAASLSAVDDKGVEGGYYLWDKAELEQQLTEDEYKVVSRFWQIQGVPDLDGEHHLIQAETLESIAKAMNKSLGQVKNILASAKQKMLAQRAKRILPKDSKILTAWNALALKALVDGAKYTDKPQYKQALKLLTGYVHQTLWDNKQQQVRRAVSNKGVVSGAGTLEDYAYLAQAVWVKWQYDQRDEDKVLLRNILLQAWQRFYSQQGWILAENMLLKYGTGTTLIPDGPLPASAAVLIETTYRFAKQTSNKTLLQQAQRALNVGHDELAANPFWYATQIKALLHVQTMH